MDLSAITSRNFEFLKMKRPELAALGAFAESYTHPDPASALVKLRTFAEQIVQSIYQALALPRPMPADLVTLLNDDAFKSAVPRIIVDKLHLLRLGGNRGAHGKPVTANGALDLLREAHDLGRWFAVAHLSERNQDIAPFISPPALAADSKGELKREKKAALEKLAAQEAKLLEVLGELQAERDRAATAEKKAAELESILAQGQRVANELHFDEATTRKRLIDAQLSDAGWKVGANGANTSEVSQEEKIEHQPLPSGVGYADYVLWDDAGRPVAVIEAKKTSVEPELGRKQAELYADGLEKKYGQRPVIFYTNGFDIWIWDDKQGYPPRKIFGFYSKDSLQYLVFQRREKKDLLSLVPKAEIAGRMYQEEAIRRITERFTDRHRKALVVQATGTGKTRVAIALTELLSRARWVKRVLFLCDRRELRKQAKNAFNDFLPSEPLTIVGARTAMDRDQRIYLATYPAMKQVFQTFDVGFFDLIIADESHRSIYNVYGDIFRHFDALQVGLTATPLEFVGRSTYRLFDCPHQQPTAYYSLERAVEEHHLVPFEVYTHTTKFLRQGIKYKELSEEQRRQLEEDGEDPKLFLYDAEDIDRQIFNKDTNRAILRNLMENGLRDATGQQPGKSIIFARSHLHAVLLRQLFDEMYPQYGGKFCQVIDNYDPRAEQLIDDFKGGGTNDQLTIAISVDMLDTGIDIPEIVNLVFAKPIKSKVKFWQMIGRGTRLCPDLFGPGRDKMLFRIFDHWGNFEYFDLRYIPAEPVDAKGVVQLVFEARLELAETALNKTDSVAFSSTIELLEKGMRGLPEETIAVREKWRELRSLREHDVLNAFTANTVTALRRDIAPLFTWMNIRGQSDAYSLDLLMTRMQTALLKGSGRLDDLKAELLDRLALLPMTLLPVREKAATIRDARSSAFWDAPTYADLERVRVELRDIMHHRIKPTGPTTLPPKIVDVAEDAAEYEIQRRSASLRSIDMRAYERLVEDTLKKHFDTDPTLKKIRAGEPVTESELRTLTALVLVQNKDVNLDVLKQFYGATAAPLDFILRSVIGMDPVVVKARFARFVQQHPSLSAKQIHFLNLLQNHIAKFGSVKLERLYEDPFTIVDADGLDGVFIDETDAREIIGLIHTFDPPSVS
jgi:type I restriction enzyme, R subunit